GRRVDRAGEGRRIHREGPGLHVDESHPRPGHRDGLRRGDEGIRGRDHLVAETDAGGPEREHDCVGAVAHPDRVLDAAIGGEVLLESLHYPPEDELAALKHLTDRLVDLPPDDLVLDLKVNEWNIHSGFLSP